MPLFVQYRWHVVQAILALFLASAFTLALPMMIKEIVTAAVAEDLAQLQTGFLVTLCVALGLGVASAYRFYMVSWLGERVVAVLRQRLFIHLTRMNSTFFDQNQIGELTSRLITDTTLVEQVVGTSLSVALRNFVLLLGSAVFLFMTSPYLSMLMLVVTPAVVAPVIYFARKYRLLSKESQAFIAESNAYANQVLSLIETVRAYQYEAAAHRHFSGVIEEGFRASKKRIWARSQLTVMIMVLVISAMVAVLWLGTLAVFTGDSGLTAGDIGQFFGYSVYISVAVAALSEVWGDLMRASGAMSRIIDLLAQPVDVQDSGADLKAYDISFDGVSFIYPLRKNIQILNKVSFEAQAGKVTALVGISGAGKSTIFKLLMGFYKHYEGSIQVGQSDSTELSTSGLRSSIALVSHQAGIFPMSLRENITLGGNYTEEAVLAAIKMANIDAFVEMLPDGLDTVVGERGVLLSEGQRQRVALARAIIRDADIVLLDEATNALDAITEEAITSALKGAFAKKTVLVIAHRLATVMDADHIVVLDQGEVQAQGTHRYLLKNSDIYRDIANIQMIISG